MRFFASFVLPCLLCFSCSQDEPVSVDTAKLKELRERLKQNFAAEDRPAAVATSVELLEAGEADPDMLVRMALTFEGARRPDALITTLERLLLSQGQHIPEEDLGLRLWMGFGRACGLSGQLGPFLATWAGVRDAPPAAVHAADRGLVALLENARAAGRSEEFRNKFEAAGKRTPGLVEAWKPFLPLLGSDRALATAARHTEGTEEILDRVILAAAEGSFDVARQAFEAAAAATEEDAPERAELLGLQLHLDIASGASLEPWLAQPLQLRDATWVRGILGRFSEALTMLEDEQTAIPPAQRRSLHIKLLREAGRTEEALGLIDGSLTNASEEQSTMDLVRARVLLELGRTEEAIGVLSALIEDPAATGKHPILLRHTLALAQILAARPEDARASLEAATRIFPINPAEVEESWGPAVYSMAPESELAGIAYSWTRFPRFKDNDYHFHAAMRALLQGDRSTAKTELNACIEKSIGGEYPCRLAERALRSAALQN